MYHNAYKFFNVYKLNWCLDTADFQVYDMSWKNNVSAINTNHKATEHFTKITDLELVHL
jgi:hypothetical protein